jgi:hypothetical protein
MTTLKDEIARAERHRDPRRRLEHLERLAGRLAGEDAAVAAIGEVHAAMVEASLATGDIDLYLHHLELRAQAAAAARGDGAPVTLRAWIELGEVADGEARWEVAARAWEAVVAAAPAVADEATGLLISRALRGLGARRLAAGDAAGAGALFERDLALREALSGPDHADLIVSLDNLATACEGRGDAPAAIALRMRQLAIVEATFGADHGMARRLRDQLAAASP